MNGVTDFVGKRHGCGPIATQDDVKLACTVDGIFARGLPVVLSATE